MSTVRLDTPIYEVVQQGNVFEARVRSETYEVSVLGSPPHAVQGTKYLSTYSGTDRTAVADSVTSVQAAIDAWAGTYKIVVDGTFKCSDPLNLPANCWLEAARPGVDGFTFTWQAASDGTYFLGNSTTDGTVGGIKLRGLNITGAGDGDPWGSATDPVNGVKLTSVYDSEVVGCTFYRVTGIAINYSGRGIRITDNDFRECGRDGITGFWRPELGLSNVLVANNRLRLMGDDCIAVWAGAAAQTNGTTATVATTANSGAVVGSGTSFVAGDVGKRIAIVGAETGAVLYEGTIATVTDSTHITVSPQCNVTNASTAAIYGFDRPSNVAIVGNVIEQNVSQDTYGGNRGINVAGCESVTISGNTVKGTHGQGIRVAHATHSDYVYSRDVTVADNTVLDAGRYAGSSGEYTGRRHGMEFDGTLSCSIVGGTVARSYGKGVYIADSISPLVSGLTVERNGTADDDCGIDFFGTGSGANLVTYPRVVGCTIRENKGAGIRFFHVRHGVVTGSAIINNGQSGAQGADQSGILCTGAIGWTITGNVITDTNASNRTQWGGIRVTNSGGSPYLIHWGNYIIGNGAGSIIYTNTSTIAVGMSYESTTANANPLSFSSGAAILSGSATPEGAVTAKVGSLYMRSDGSTGTTLYVKESGTGNTGWVAVSSASGALLASNNLSDLGSASTARTNLGLGSLATLSSVGTSQLAADSVTTAKLGYDLLVVLQVTDPAGSAITTGDGKAYFTVPALLNGMNLTSVAASLTTVSSSGTPTVQIANVTDSVDMLSTKVTIDANELTSYTAAAAAVIDTTKDDVATGDLLRVDVDVAGTGAKGLSVMLGFATP